MLGSNAWGALNRRHDNETQHIRCKLFKRVNLYFMRALIFTLWLTAWVVPAIGCDICGCSAIDARLGVLPDYRQNTFSIGLNHRRFSSSHPALFSWELPTVSNEAFTRLEWSARVFINRSWLVMASVPMNAHRQVELNAERSLMGLGDAVIGAGRLFNFELGNQKQHLGQIMLSASVKLPTGVHDAKVNGDDFVIPNLQPGSGSWDLLVNVNYMQRLDAWGFQSQLALRYNGVNPAGYRFGNRRAAAFKAFRFIDVGERKLLPGVEIAVGSASPDLLSDPHGQLNELSGGRSVMVSSGIDFFTNRWGVSTSVALPVYQRMAGGHLTSKGSGSLVLIYLL